MEPSPTLMLLLVEHNFQKDGNPFHVNTTSGDNVADIVEKVRVEKPNALSRAHVDPSDLIVWRTKGASNIHSLLTSERLAEILSGIDVNDQDMIEEVYKDKRVADLGLSDCETLLLQLPEPPSVGPATGPSHSILAKRKAREEYFERLKSCKLANITPSDLSENSKYSELQKDQEEKILDDRPEPDLVIPPLPLLYRGFGHFLDSTSVAAIKSGTFSYLEIGDDVDKLVKEVCKTEDEKDKKRNILGLLNRILFRGEAEFGYCINGTPQKDYVPAAYGGPLFIVGYKRQMELAGRFHQLAACSSSAKAQIFRGWRQPSLGLVIRGSYISFLGLVMIDTQVRMLPLTPTFPCTDSELESRAPLYAAFSAARDLLKIIEKDAKEFVEYSLEYSAPENHSQILNKFPDIQSLSLCQLPSDSQQEHQIDFQITETLGYGVQGRFLYLAETGSQTILVKFSRMYSKELHEFCAARSYAPRLLAFEKLPGGWFGIAMEYLSEADRVIDSPFLIKHGATWLKKMEEIVKAFHKQGYVHGDLRAPNFIIDKEKLLLVDFDWGGKEGEAKFPDVKLVPILRGGRHEELIQKYHDTKVLETTMAEITNKIRELVNGR